MTWIGTLGGWLLRCDRCGYTRGSTYFRDTGRRSGVLDNMDNRGYPFSYMEVPERWQTRIMESGKDEHYCISCKDKPHVEVKMPRGVYERKPKENQDGKQELQPMAATMPVNNIGPSYDDFRQSVESTIYAALNAAIADVGKANAAKALDLSFKDLAEFLAGLVFSSTDINDRLERGGREYGEDVLFLLGEGGNVSMVVTKAMRLLWSFRNGYPESSRQDSWLDIAAYAILEMARYNYVVRKQTEGGNE